MPPTHNKTGRSRNRSGNILVAPLQTTTQPHHRNKIAGQFAARTIEMLESPAFCVLTLSGRRILDRLEIELAHHGGQDNGALPVTYDNFEDYGIDRHSIAPAMREVEALGFIQVTVRGRAGNADSRTPNRFRITYKPSKHAVPTDDWKKIKTTEEAKQIALAARKEIKRVQPKRADKEQRPMGEITRFNVENPHRNAERSNGGNPHYNLSGLSPTTLDISGTGRSNCPPSLAAPMNAPTMKGWKRRMPRGTDLFTCKTDGEG